MPRRILVLGAGFAGLWSALAVLGAETRMGETVAAAPIIQAPPENYGAGEKVVAAGA